MQLKQIPRDVLLRPLASSHRHRRTHVTRCRFCPMCLLEQKDGRLDVTATDLEIQITAYSELAGKQDAGRYGLCSQAAGYPSRAAGRYSSQHRYVGRNKTDGSSRQDRVQPADLAGGRLSAHKSWRTEQCRRLRCRKRSFAGLLRLVRIRDGATGHSVLPERIVVGRGRKGSLKLVATDGHRLA